MIKDINIRFNLDKEEHKKAWDYMQKMDRKIEKSYSKVIIKSLIRYFENTDAENKAEMPESYWERFRIEMEKLLKEQTIFSSLATGPSSEEMGNKELAEKGDNHLLEISEDVLDALEDLF